MSAGVAADAVIEDVRPTADPATATLVAAAAAGDEAACERLLAEVQPAVLKYCRARLGNGAVATEVTRRVCAGFAATLPDLAAGDTHLRAFVHRIAATAVDGAMNGAVGAPPAELPGMAGMLALLSSAEREVLVLRVAVGLSADETAVTLGSSVAAVRKLQHTALDRLRARD